MKRNIILILSFIWHTSYCQTFQNDPCFTRIFEDNFTTLNTTNWAVQNRISWTDDSTWDLPANVTIQNSDFLRILLERRRHNGRPFCGGEITSTALYNAGTYFETRARNPTGPKGFCSAVWTWHGLNNNGTMNCACAIQNPSLRCGCQNYHELDFLEYFGTEKNRSSRNRIWCTQNGMCTIGIEDNYYFGTDIPTDWHTYGCYWNRQGTSFFYDDKVTLATNTVSQHPMNIDISLWAHHWSVDANTTFPKEFLVDYIRVFRINRSNNQCSVIINNPANLTGYTWNLKRSITFTTTVLPSNQRLSFWATDFIDLNGGLTIPTSNQEITFAIGECW